MDPHEFLSRVWSAQGEGFGFISVRNGQSWRDMPVHVPDEEIVLPDLGVGDVYFTPNLFSKPRRRNENCLASRWLFADLDAVDPHLIEPKLMPDVAWESSPGRYQGLWLVQQLPPETHSVINKQLTYKLDADKGGWDLSQVLRLPGTHNRKYDDEPLVTLLWFNEKVNRYVKGRGYAIASTAAGPLLNVVPLNGKRLPTFVRSRLRASEARGDRSRVLYRMERELLQAKFTKDEVFTLLRGCVWNKFNDRGLSDDIHRVAARLSTSR